MEEGQGEKKMTWEETKTKRQHEGVQQKQSGRKEKEKKKRMTRERQIYTIKHRTVKYICVYQRGRCHRPELSSQWSNFLPLPQLACSWEQSQDLQNMDNRAWSCAKLHSYTTCLHADNTAQTSKCTQMYHLMYNTVMLLRNRFTGLYRTVQMSKANIRFVSLVKLHWSYVRNCFYKTN